MLEVKDIRYAILADPDALVLQFTRDKEELRGGPFFSYYSGGLGRSFLSGLNGCFFLCFLLLARKACAKREGYQR